MISLEIRDEGVHPRETRVLDFAKDEVTVGRVRGNDLVYPRGNCHKRHLRFRRLSGQVWLENLGTQTYVDGKLIGGYLRPIYASQRIYIGAWMLRVLNAPSAPDPNAQLEASTPVIACTFVLSGERLPLEVRCEGGVWLFKCGRPHHPSGEHIKLVLFEQLLRQEPALAELGALAPAGRATREDSDTAWVLDRGAA